MGSCPAQESSHAETIVIGGGFTGCYMFHHLRKKGYKVKLLESSPTIGGIWESSRYPGARVDIEMPWYGYSDPAIWASWTWNERFPSAFSLREYFKHVVDVWDLHEDIEFNTKVVSASYLEDTSTWQVETATGVTYSCKWLMTALGSLTKPAIPEWTGFESFEGIVHHSYSWPESLSLKGKRVAVIGAGSSGVQVMQEAAKVSSSVTHFIRTPGYALPMRQRKVTEEEIYAQRPLIPHIFKACRQTPSGMTITGLDRGVFEDSPQEREAQFEELWKRGGFNFVQGSYKDYRTDKKANREVYNFWCKKTRARISDPIKRDLLAPLELPYFFGTKRATVEQDYYESCDSKHVDVTNSPIERFTATGVLTMDGKHRDFDVVVVCTGYDAIAGPLRGLGIRGRKGQKLEEKWHDGVLTNLGLFVNGFPNLITLYGPQAPTSAASSPTFSELQCEWIFRVIAQQKAHSILTIEASKEAEEAWRKEVLMLAGKSLIVETDSWIMGSNDPGTRRECLLYLGGMPRYFQHCEEALANWKDFEIHYER